MRIRLLLVVIAAWGSAQPAPAEPGPDYGRTGFYLGADASFAVFTEAKQQIRATLMTASPDLRTDTTVGFNVRGGYRFHERFAAELEYEWNPGPVAKLAGNAKVTNGTTWFVSTNLKGYLRKDTRFQPFLLVGTGYLQSVLRYPTIPLEQAAGGFAARMGLGFDAYITRNLIAMLDVEYVLPAGRVSKLDYISVGLGLGWRF